LKKLAKPFSIATKK
jgi:hypothetical protein